MSIPNSFSWPGMARNQFQTSTSSLLSFLLISNVKKPPSWRQRRGAVYRSNFAATSEGGNRKELRKSGRLTLCCCLGTCPSPAFCHSSLTPGVAPSHPNWTINSESNSRVLKMRRRKDTLMWRNTLWKLKKWSLAVKRSNLINVASRLSSLLSNQLITKPFGRD